MPSGLGDNSEEGVYKITYTAPDDSADNTPMSKERIVNVIPDTEKPLIKLVGDSTILHPQNDDYEEWCWINASLTCGA